MRLQGKTLGVIGGTSGIGLSAAKAFLAEGARVVVVGKDAESVNAARSQLSGQAQVLAGDACVPATATTAIETALREFGSFHGLYHVAGGSGRKFGDGPLHEITDEGWNYTLNENLTTLFYSNRAAAQQFCTQGGGGSVLNI